MEAATRCNSGAGEAAGAGVESPTVLPEREDRLSERTALHVSHPGSGHQDMAMDTPPSWFVRVGRGVFCRNPPSPSIRDLGEQGIRTREWARTALRAG